MNESREKLEKMIMRMHKDYHLPLPRRYAKKARREYLAYAKCKKPSSKKIRKALRSQLSFVARDLVYMEEFLKNGCELNTKEQSLYETIKKLYEQQKYMYDNKIHKVEDRIVSITQPWLQPIVRGKIKAPVEFGAKLDLSLDSKGYARIEKISFDAFNESNDLQEAAERYKERTGAYPERILADQIYRTRKNRAFCKAHGIRLSGPKLGRPVVSEEKALENKHIEYKDNTDRIEVEREFSLQKRCYGLGKIVTKLQETQLESVKKSL